MTKAEHVVKFLNETIRKAIKDHDIEEDFTEVLDNLKYYAEDYKFSLVTEFEGEKIDLTDLRFTWGRNHDHCSYHTLIDDIAIGIGGYYDSWNGTTWDDNILSVGKLYTSSYTTFR